jgi:SAM-dependent MidA family methyltransferase
MSALADRLRERIRREGPITFYEWMKAALYDPEHGYYCRADRERWGRGGDYRTSPERSFLFAATFARYFAGLHAALGSPTEWTIVEAGAGGGHFAETVLVTLQRFPEVLAATRYVIDEVSATSRSQTQDRLARFAARVDFKKLQESNTLNPGIIFANELLDAFPVHRVTMREGELREFYVGLNDSEDFEWIIDAPVPSLATQVAQHDVHLKNDQIAEINPGIEQWLQLVSSKLDKGFLIIVDYGAEAAKLYSSAERSKGTLRPFHRHQFAEDVLGRVGEQDLTTSINWTLVRSLLTKYQFRVVAFERQDRFLLSADLLEELELRANKAQSEAERVGLRTGAREMILPGGMAESFQVLVAEKGDRLN